ncbi:Aldose 1-epimerase family protein [Brugia malayi]|uniref:Aldose 1-epimerase n=2 Tax=Brugia TaxID=6278 RepID=A0A0H5SQ52_BRUMA|nr:Aldose 1-epimerase family protein [Brugia malayi]CRZ25698.1 Bm1861 [Brugia malayi]VIO97991.1 Aldose 1-epimerase family protein [Brugia malayi]
MLRLITIEQFGMTKASEERVVKISLTNNNGMKIELLNYGAILMSALVPDRNDILRDIVLGFRTLQEYESDAYNIGAIIGRVAGHISNGKFAVDSREYELGLNAPPHHMNGGRRGSLSKKLWNYELLDEGNGVCFTCISHDGEGGYPGQVHLEVTYILTNENEIIIDYRASTNKSTILNIANNAYFNLNGEGKSSLNDHIIQLCTPNYLPADENGFATDLLDNDNNQLDYNHDFCFEIDELNTSRKIRHIASVASTSSGIKMTVSTTYPCVHVNMGSWLNNLTGKANHVYERYSAFTLQCRGLSDAINQPHFPTIILRPDELYQHLTVYRFGLVDE